MASKKWKPLLVGTFALFPRKKSMYKVTVTRAGITYVYESNKDDEQAQEKYIHFGDIIGCRCRKSKTPDDQTAYFTIYAYPFRKKTVGSKQLRHRIDVTFGTCDYQEFKENFFICQKWRNVIVHLARGTDLSIEDVETCSLPDPLKMLILINPHSGPGRAQQIFEKEVEPMLLEADIRYEVTVTEYAGHATEIMKTLNLSQWYSVVIVSGDGLIYEVINGLMQRPDWEDARKFPVGCIPGGSGNALCWSINYQAGEPLGEEMILHSTFVLIKHRIIPMDLVLVQTPTQKIYSFLSVTWGIVADIDYESEKLRSIGAARFTVYLLLRVMKLRSYSGKLSFLPVNKYVPKSECKQQNIAPKKGNLFMKRSASREAANSVSEVGCQGRYIPQRQISDNPDRLRSVSVPVMPHSIDRLESINSLSSVFDEELKDENLSDIGRIGKTNGVRFSDRNGHDAAVGVASDMGRNGDGKAVGPANHFEYSNDNSQENLNYAAENESSSLLTPLDQPVPANWVTVQGDFITVLAVYQPYLGQDSLAAPESRLNDGVIHLLFLRAGVPRTTLIGLFLQFVEGEHVNSPYVEYVKVHAFRLEPDTTAGNLMIDGERIEVSPVQAQIVPGMSRIMAIQ